MNLPDIVNKINAETPYEVYAKEDGYWFRYDIEESISNETYDKYVEIKEVLEGYGVYLEDAQIEHDCISGDLVKIEEPKNTDYVKSTTACDDQLIGAWTIPSDEEIQRFTVSPIERRDSIPSRYRLAIYPSGEQVMQAGTAVHKGLEVSWEWEPIETVYVDDEGNEINNDSKE